MEPLCSIAFRRVDRIALNKRLAWSDFVVLNGVVIGDVHGGEHVELASKARVAGNVYYNLIEMAVGAEVNGKLVHTQVADDVPLALGHVSPMDDS